MGDAEKAKRFRARADGLRSIAASLPADNKQRMILSIATEYERLAESLDNEPQDPVPKKPDAD